MLLRLRRNGRAALAALGVAALLLQAVLVCFGAGSRLCLDPVCWSVAPAAAAADCCENHCDAGGDPPPAGPCDCRWLPLPDGPLADAAIPAPVPDAAAPALAKPVLLPVPPAPLSAVQAVPPRQARPPPHLAVLRCTVLIC